MGDNKIKTDRYQLVRWGHFGDNKESKTHTLRGYRTGCGKKITGGANYFSGSIGSINCKICKKVVR